MIGSLATKRPQIAASSRELTGVITSRGVRGEFSSTLWRGESGFDLNPSLNILPLGVTSKVYDDESESLLIAPEVDFDLRISELLMGCSTSLSAGVPSARMKCCPLRAVNIAVMCTSFQMSRKDWQAISIFLVSSAVHEGVSIKWGVRTVAG